MLKVPIPTSAQHLGRGYLPATVLATQPPLYLDRVLLAQMQLPSQVMLPQLLTAMDPPLVVVILQFPKLPRCNHQQLQC